MRSFLFKAGPTRSVVSPPCNFVADLAHAWKGFEIIGLKVKVFMKTSPWTGAKF
jgi:hypothetical protein